MMTEILTGLGALCGGGLIVWAVLRPRLVQLQIEKESSEKSRAADLQRFENETSTRERLYRESLERERLAAKEGMAALQSRFDETVAKMKAELEASTEAILKRRSAELDASSREGVGKILAPLNQTIDEMKKAVADNTVRHTEMGGRLNAVIRTLLEQSEAARQSADRLADALHGSTMAQGTFGETVLTELLQLQGLREGVHFETQTKITDSNGKPVLSDDGRELIPDVVLHLDDERDVIIDAKVSLTSWLDYCNGSSEDIRERALKAHVASIEAQAARLAKKDYSKYVQPPKKSVGYVIMFVPVTAAVHAACAAKPSLWRDAMAKNVYIADEQTLYAALKIIQLTWRQIDQAANHEKVFALADELLARTSKFLESFSAVGDSMDNARKTYEEALAKLSDSGRSIPVTCRKLIKLGAKQPKGKKGVHPLLADTNPESSEDTVVSQIPDVQ